MLALACWISAAALILLVETASSERPDAVGTHPERLCYPSAPPPTRPRFDATDKRRVVDAPVPG